MALPSARRAFIFDIGNVLLPFDLGRAVRRVQRHCPFPIERIQAQLDPLKLAYESGQIDRAAFLSELIRLLDYRAPESELIAAWSDIFEENHAMTRLVRRLHAHYPLYLLSNTNDLHTEHFLAAYRVFECFGDAVYSHCVGQFKPDRSIYETAMRQFGLAPAEIIFIDDLAPNIATARALGWSTVHYDYRNHGACLGALRQLGIPELLLEER
jgi:putative hydrolase of the HAD superfamily